MLPFCSSLWHLLVCLGSAIDGMARSVFNQLSISTMVLS